MRQRRWIELFSEYECEIRYHPGKTNVVADALSKKERVKPKHVRAMAMTIQSGVKGMILAAQCEAFKQENVLAERLHGLDQQMERKGDGSLYFMDRTCVTPPFLHIAAEANLGYYIKSFYKREVPKSKIQSLNDNGFAIFESSPLRAIGMTGYTNEESNPNRSIHNIHA
ncbi:hypothetical protein Tco_0911015 [Tanacetum coccineum]|uniref:Reverse transcriptase domain-containing protein n=1 Tax=Tanacetum coccineum TaxID=301880 RepID=A0ABQ5CUJ8_9ASTR